MTTSPDAYPLHEFNNNAITVNLRSGININDDESALFPTFGDDNFSTTVINKMDIVNRDHEEPKAIQLKSDRSEVTVPVKDSKNISEEPLHRNATTTNSFKKSTEINLQLCDELIEQEQTKEHTKIETKFDVEKEEKMQQPKTSEQEEKVQQGQEENVLNDSILDDIPVPIKVLDDIISEFENSSSKPAAVINGENQSEDDGYMSLSRKNMHKKNSSEEGISPESIKPAPSNTPDNNFQKLDILCNAGNKADFENFNLNDTYESTTDQNITQSTLPKARCSLSMTNNYSSLPCCGARSSSLEIKYRGGSCNGGRNALGIDISAVHNAVLRGNLAKLPELIANEHPVTIYPGPLSPVMDGIRSNRPKRLISSVEKHKEVCQILNPLSPLSSSSSSNSLPTNSRIRHNKPQRSSSPVLNKHDLKNNSKSDYTLMSLEKKQSSPQRMSSQSKKISLHKPSGIAWVISFDRNKKKTKYSTFSNKKAKKSHAELINQHSIRHEFNGDDYREDEEENQAPHEQLGDEFAFRYRNMMGRGTYIIRHASKSKPPNVIDIFSTPTNELLNRKSPSESNACEPEISLVDISNATDSIGSNPRRSQDLNLRKNCKAETSPRERLCLHVENQHLVSSLKKDNVNGGPLPAEKILLEECTESSCNLDRSQLTQSRESISDISSSLDEESRSDLKDNSNHYETCNLYQYKSQTTTGLKTQEVSAELRSSNTTTPHTDLAPTIEEDEEQFSDFSYGCAAPLRQIENNISALLRGDMVVMCSGVGSPPAVTVSAIVDVTHPPKRPLEFRPGVHKSESAKEMLLSQNAFGPLPPSPLASNPDLFNYEDRLPPLPPLPPSPTELLEADDHQSLRRKTNMRTTSVEVHTQQSPSEEFQRLREIRSKSEKVTRRHFSDDLPLLPQPFEPLPPAVPPHRGHSTSTIKSWSIDSNFKRRSPKMLHYSSGVTTPTGGVPPTSSYGDTGSGYPYNSSKRFTHYGTKRSLKQSPREEHRLQTSCSLPETPIFARGCDIPRTPFRRQNESNTVSGSRTAPRSSTSHSINMGTSIVGIAGGSTFNSSICRQRSINHALASNEMLRLSGVPARGWYPKQRSMRPFSTENIDRLPSMRVWDSAAGISGTSNLRKPLTLPPNLTPSFLNKSPREALRRVTSLLITKKSKNSRQNTKEYKDRPKPYYEPTMPVDMDPGSSVKEPIPRNSNKASQQKNQKKKGLFKTLWKKTKHFSLDQ